MRNKTDEFIQKVNKYNKHLKIVGEYIASNKPIKYICPHCNEIKEVKNASDLTRGYKYGCQSCNIKKVQSEKTAKSKEKLRKKINTFENIEIVKYKTHPTEGKIMAELHCTECGHNWTVLGSNVVKVSANWKGCPVCYEKSDERNIQRLKGLEKNVEKSKKITKEKFLNWLKENNYSLLEEVDDYTTLTQVKLKCNVCNEKWSTNIGHCLRGRGNCKACNGYKINEYYLNIYIKENRKDIELVKYNSKGKSIFRCLECNREFKQYHHHITKGGKCIHCAISKGELAVKSILEDLNINYIMQHSFKEYNEVKRLRFDFYIPNKNICIEYQGEQHYRPVEYFGGEKKFKDQVKKDNLKRKFCKENDIKLIEIPYHVNDIKHILEKNIA